MNDPVCLDFGADHEAKNQWMFQYCLLISFKNGTSVCFVCGYIFIGETLRDVLHFSIQIILQGMFALL